MYAQSFAAFDAVSQAQARVAFNPAVMLLQQDSTKPRRVGSSSGTAQSSCAAQAQGEPEAAGRGPDPAVAACNAAGGLGCLGPDEPHSQGHHAAA